MAELPFWDEECLRGSIDRGPLPPPPRSLFESDLFCNEDVENDPLPPPHISPDNDFLFNNQDAFSSPARAPLSPTPFLSSSPPLTRHPPPFPMSPIRPLAATPPRPGWKSFLDDNCPLRKRVKVTITPSARARRSLGLTSPEPPAKKPRLASPPRDYPTPQVHVPRRRQTTLRLSRSGDLAGRIMLHLPSNSSAIPSSPPANQIFSCKQLNSRSKSTNSRNNNTTDLTMEDKLHTMAFGQGSEPEPEPESEPARQPSSDPELDLEIALEQDFDSDTCAKLEENCSFAETLERTLNTMPEDNPSSQTPPTRAIPVKHNPRQRAPRRECITSDLSQRLSFVTQNLSLASSARRDSGLMKPLVDAAVQAVTCAAQTYSSLLTKVSSSPPAIVFADAWRSPRVTASGHKPTKRASRTRTARGNKVGKVAVKRKRCRRRRTLLSFDDHEVQPLHDGRSEELNSQMDDNSALASYLNSPTTLRTEALAC